LSAVIVTVSNNSMSICHRRRGFRLRGAEITTCPNIQSRIIIRPGRGGLKRLRAPPTYICNMDFISVIFVMLPFLFKQ